MVSSVAEASWFFAIYSAVYLLGYFSSADIHLIYYLTPSDFVAGFVSAAPSIVVPFLVGLVLSMLWRSQQHSRPSDKKPTTPAERQSWIRTNSIFVGVWVIIAGALAIFHMPWQFTAMALLVVFVWGDGLYKATHDRFEFDRQIVQRIIAASTIGLIIFEIGTSEGKAAYDCKSMNAAVLVGTERYPGCIFWISSGGILLSQGTGSVVFYPKEKVDRVGNFPAQ